MVKGRGIGDGSLASLGLDAGCPGSRLLNCQMSMRPFCLGVVTPVGVCTRRGRCVLWGRHRWRGRHRGGPIPCQMRVGSTETRRTHVAGAEVGRDGALVIDFRQQAVELAAICNELVPENTGGTYWKAPDVAVEETVARGCPVSVQGIVERDTTSCVRSDLGATRRLLRDFGKEEWRCSQRWLLAVLTRSRSSQALCSCRGTDVCVSFIPGVRRSRSVKFPAVNQQDRHCYKSEQQVSLSRR